VEVPAVLEEAVLAAVLAAPQEQQDQQIQAVAVEPAL
jgi:hypothetical protein